MGNRTLKAGLFAALKVSAQTGKVWLEKPGKMPCIQQKKK